MNTLLHFADAALQYHRGKQVGLWGLIGIALGILAVAMWDKIVPFFELIGLVDFFSNLGIIHTNASYMSAFKIFMFFFMASIAFMLLGWVFLGIFSVVIGMAQNSFIQKLLIGLIAIVLSPLIILVMLYYMIFNKKARQDRQLMKDDPEGYKDMVRLRKNKLQIDYLKYGANGDKNNIITYEEAYNRLNRLPTFGDHMYLIGITYDRDIYMLVPGALQTTDYKSPGEVHAEQLEMSMHPVFGNDSNNTTTYKVDIILTKPKKDLLLNMCTVPINTIEEYIEPSNVEVVNSFYKKYGNSKFFSKVYVPKILNYFFKRKDKLITEIQEATTKEEYKTLFDELQNHSAPNEDIVRLIWDGHKAKQNEEEERINGREYNEWS